MRQTIARHLTARCCYAAFHCHCRSKPYPGEFRRHRFRHNPGQHYRLPARRMTIRFDSVTKAVGLLARIKPETVRVYEPGQDHRTGPRPLSFALTREVDTQKNASAKFNWEKSVLTDHDYKGVNDLPLAKGTQDGLSVLYHLRRCC